MWGHADIPTIYNRGAVADPAAQLTIYMAEDMPSRWQTILYAAADTQNVGDHDGDVSETKLTERQQKILNLIKESPTITGKQMSVTLSVSQRTIERNLSALQKLGVLKREGKDNNGKWVVVKNNAN